MEEHNSVGLLTPEVVFDLGEAPQNEIVAARASGSEIVYAKDRDARFFQVYRGGQHINLAHGLEKGEVFEIDNFDGELIVTGLERVRGDYRAVFSRLTLTPSVSVERIGSEMGLMSHVVHESGYIYWSPEGDWRLRRMNLQTGVVEKSALTAGVGPFFAISNGVLFTREQTEQQTLVRVTFDPPTIQRLPVDGVLWLEADGPWIYASRNYLSSDPDLRQVIRFRNDGPPWDIQTLAKNEVSKRVIVLPRVVLWTSGRPLEPVLRGMPKPVGKPVTLVADSGAFLSFVHDGFLWWPDGGRLLRLRVDAIENAILSAQPSSEGSDAGANTSP